MVPSPTFDANHPLQAVDQPLASFRSLVERERVRAHLARAEARLRVRRPPNDVDPDGRAAHLDALRAYWRRGEFPINREFRRRKPLFRGPGGTRCAMGAVVAADGRSDVVDAVVSEDNTVDLETDVPPSALVEWIDDAGLTAEEAAFVQPMYDPACRGPLTCSQLRMLLATVGLIAACWMEYGLYRVLGDRIESTAARAVGFLVGSAVGLLAIAALLLAVYGALFSAGWAA